MTAHYETQNPKTIYLHWSGVDSYSRVFTDYHTCITARRSWYKPWTWVAEAKYMHPYNKALHHHTWRRNTDAIAVSCSGAGPNTPIRKEQVEVMCLAVARAAVKYNIPVDSDHILTHAESARALGYWPERTDFDGRGDELRAKIRYYVNKIKAGELKP